MKRTCKIALFVLMVVFALASMTACGKTKLDVADGVTVVFSGADGNGYAELIHDEENPSEMAPKFLLKLVKDKKVAADDWQKLMTIGSAVSYDLDKSSKLSNGDTVTVTISVDKDVLNNLKMTAEPAKLTFTVKGLTEVKTIKPFQNFEISYDGISPNAQVKDYTRSEEIDGTTVNYYIDTTSNLREGQEITVTATLRDNTYYKLSEDTMTVTVTGVDKYISSSEEILPETMNAMRQKADALMQGRFGKEGYPTDYYQFSGFEYAGYVFLTRNEDTSYGDANICYLMYTVQVCENGQNYTSTYFARFHDILQHTDGTQEVDLESYSGPFFNDDIYLKDYQTLDARYKEIEDTCATAYHIEKHF